MPTYSISTIHCAEDRVSYRLHEIDAFFLLPVKSILSRVVVSPVDPKDIALPFHPGI